MVTDRKGILLAGGTGTRLYPSTFAVSKQLLPVYDKPMVYYPLSVLMLSGIRDVALITTPRDLDLFVQLLGDGSKWGMSIRYVVQPEPGGIAQAFLLTRDFINNSCSTLILGDNIFYGDGLTGLLSRAAERRAGASIFAYHVNDPERYGVVDFDKECRVISIEEKPLSPKSNYAVTGLYFYDENVCEFASSLKPSVRGELEITDLNKCYLNLDRLNVEIMGRGYAWLDTGTHESLLDASAFVASLQKRQGLQVACPEEIAFTSGWIDAEQLSKLIHPLRKTEYGIYLQSCLDGTL